MDKTDQQTRLLHLYSRAGFGISYPEWEDKAKQPLEKSVSKLFRDSDLDEPIRAAENLLAGQERQRPKNMQRRRQGGDPDTAPSMEGDSRGRASAEKPSREQLRMLLKQGREQVKDVNIAWIKQMSTSPAVLREKMTFFWHDHFACRSNNGFFAQQLNNVHRKYALGSFRELLLEVSKSPAMLQFLNNQQNRKQKPNENFARELMELFTIGRGHYTEQDVREAARAFTGWAYRPASAVFTFRKKQHDFGSKTFMGKTGNFNGEDIIDIILEKKETADFLAEKLYRFFVNEVSEPAPVQELSQTLYQSDYDIGKTMEKMLGSSWFYDEKNIGTRIKSPVEFIVGLNRSFGLQYEDDQSLLLMQRALGQVLFYPPNVSGWAGGQSWIDSTTLISRLRIPSVLLNGGEIELAGNPDPEEEAIIAQNEKFKSRLQRRIKASVNWERFLGSLPETISREELAALLLAPGLQSAHGEFLSLIKEKDAKTIVIQLVSLPEYQLC